MTQAILGKAAATGSPAEAAAAEARKRERFRTARLLTAFNAWVFGAAMLHGFTHRKRKKTGAERVATCGARRNATPALKRMAEGDGRVKWTGIQTCGSVWSCLACAAKVRARRATEIDRLAKAHLAAGGSLTFITLTLPHVATDSLDDLMTAVDRAWANVIKGGAWQYGVKVDFEISGQIKAVEATLGLNGWHPHLHVLFFHNIPSFGADGSLERFRDALGARWGASIERQLGRTIHEYYGVDAVCVRDDKGLGDYVSKIQFELARNDLKHGDQDFNSRSPWQVGLDAKTTGEAQDTARWVEWYWAMKGRNAITVSPSLRELYGKDSSSGKTDEELAAEEQAGEIEVEFSAAVYDDLRRHGRHSPALADAALAFQDHGLPGLLRYVTRTLRRRVGVVIGGGIPKVIHVGMSAVGSEPSLVTRSVSRAEEGRMA